MARIRLKGLNCITKKLADGTRRTYWYAWKGGPENAIRKRDAIPKGQRGCPSGWIVSGPYCLSPERRR